MNESEENAKQAVEQMSDSLGRKLAAPLSKLDQGKKLSDLKAMLITMHARFVQENKFQKGELKIAVMADDSDSTIANIIPLDTYSGEFLAMYWGRNS